MSTDYCENCKRFTPRYFQDGSCQNCGRPHPRNSGPLIRANKGSNMHYKNGREAKNGDPIMVIPDPKYGGKPMTGILYDAKAGNDYCNGRIALTASNDPTPNLKECLHLEDAMALLAPPD